MQSDIEDNMEVGTLNQVTLAVISNDTEEAVELHYGTGGEKGDAAESETKW